MEGSWTEQGQVMERSWTNLTRTKIEKSLKILGNVSNKSYESIENLKSKMND